MFRIAPEDPRDEAGAALLGAMNAFAIETYPEYEIAHMFSAEMLAREAKAFLVARRESDGVALGCGALFLPEPGVGRINRMFVTDNARGLGIGAALLASLESLAIESGARTMRLETGFRQVPALTLYRERGYREREPFPPYSNDGLRIFFEKRLAPDSAGNP